MSPGRLVLLVAIAALVATYVVLQQRRRHHAVRFTNLALLASVAPSRAGWRRHVSAALLLASLALLVVAYAQPVREQTVAREEATILLAIDVSLSMEATDVEPSRLAAARAAATRFVQDLPADLRLGLITFAGTVSVRVPPTDDHAASLAAIEDLELAEATAIGEVIYSALGIASDITPEEGDAPPVRLVLLSDGTTTVGRPTEQAADDAAAAGLQVSTIAFGTDQGVVFDRGVPVPVPVDEVALEYVADVTGGSFFEAATGEELGSVYDDIGTSVGSEVVQVEITATFVGFALALAIAAAIASMVWTARLP